MAVSVERTLITDNCLPAVVRVESGYVTLPRAAWGRALVALCNKSNRHVEPDVGLLSTASGIHEIRRTPVFSRSSSCRATKIVRQLCVSFALIRT